MFRISDGDNVLTVSTKSLQLSCPGVGSSIIKIRQDYLRLLFVGSIFNKI